MICYIVGAGEGEVDFQPGEDDFVIAADGGVRKLEEKQIGIDLCIGDFDSLGYVPNGKQVITLPVEKDDTDLVAAVREGRKRGYDSFVFYGVYGGRVDHTFAMIQTMVGLVEENCQVVAYGTRVCATVIKNNTIRISKGNNHYFSLFSLSNKAENVYVKGAHYNLEGTSLSYDYPLGCSNQFEEEEVEITVGDGVLLIILCE